MNNLLSDLFKSLNIKPLSTQEKPEQTLERLLIAPAPRQAAPLSSLGVSQEQRTNAEIAAQAAQNRASRATQQIKAERRRSLIRKAVQPVNLTKNLLSE